MKLVESILTRNLCYAAGRRITVKGLMLHSIGCPQSKASAFVSSWDSPTHGSSCVHGFIDGEDGTVYQTLPWNHRGWHCGSGNRGSGNNTHIGVEMCEPACIRYTAGSNFTCSDVAAARAVAERTYGATVELFVMLCEKYGLDPLTDGVVISHRGGLREGDCQQPRRPRASVGTAWHGVHDGQVSQGGQGGKGGRSFRHRWVYQDYGESRGNGGAGEGVS